MSQSNPRIGRRDFLKTTAAAAGAVALQALSPGRAGGQATRPARRPNIVFVFSDEHRWCSLPFTESPFVVAPNMARMAKEGTRFDNCVSTSPICVPYRGMLLTGLWPHQSSCVSNDSFGDADIIGVKSPTIAQVFKKAGYVTGYVGKWHLKDETCKNAGFDYFKHWLFGDDHWETKVQDIPSGEDFQVVKGYNATGMTDQAIDFIGKQARVGGGDTPFLLMLSINPPHWKWDDAPEEFLKLYPQDKLPLRPNVTEDRFKKGQELLYYQHYNAHITAVDRELGRLMDELKKLGIDDNTILIYTSDHGSSFGSNGVGSKGNPFDESVRVPFLVRCPGKVPAGRVADNNLGTMDLFPTLCGLAEIEVPKFCGGQDFSAAVLGKGGPDPSSQLIVVNNFQRNYLRGVLDPGGPNIFYPFRGVRTKQYTFAVRADGDWILYDNQKDPHQLKNLVNDPALAQVKAELRKELDAQIARSEDPFIPAEWKAMPLPDRIAAQNRHYSLMPFKAEWDKLKSTAVAPYLAGASADQQKSLRAAADKIYNEETFGRYWAINTELKASRRQTKIPAEKLQADLAELEKRHVAELKAEAQKILGGAR